MLYAYLFVKHDLKENFEAFRNKSLHIFSLGSPTDVTDVHSNGPSQAVTHRLLNPIKDLDCIPFRYSPQTVRDKASEKFNGTIAHEG
jgi:hypothetical protein